MSTLSDLRRSDNLTSVVHGRFGLSRPQPIRASLFITCIIDQLYPEVGVSVVRVLRRSGVEVDFPAGQTCCGQPLYNSGFTQEAKKLARRTLEAMESSDYVVAPSGSCGAMLRVFYLDLFADDAEMSARARDLSNRVYEFTEFLTEVVGVERRSGSETSRQGSKVAYHPSCHLLREMEVKEAPAQLLQSVDGVLPVSLPNAEQCCGFGGTFAVKYPHISQEMLGDKIDAIIASGADMVTACDMGCLMHIGGGLSRRQSPVKARHIAQVLDGSVG